jgi:hypothetical protein
VSPALVDNLSTIYDGKPSSANDSIFVNSLAYLSLIISKHPILR